MSGKEQVKQERIKDLERRLHNVLGYYKWLSPESKRQAEDRIELYKQEYFELKGEHYAEGQGGK